MIQTPLELCLSIKLPKIVGEYKDRLYREDIKIAARIDDIEKPMPKNLTDKMKWMAFDETRYQFYEGFNSLLFVREGILKNLVLDHIVLSEKEIENSKEDADKIVKNRQYDEIIIIYEKDKIYDYLVHLYFEMNKKLELDITTSNYKYSEALKKIKRALHKKIKYAAGNLCIINKIPGGK